MVLTAAHVTGERGTAVSVYAAGSALVHSAVVVWRGRPAGRDDAALVQVDDASWPPFGAGSPPPFGRVVTNLPGVPATGWGFPQWVQRADRPAELWQPSGTIDPGNRYI